MVERALHDLGAHSGPAATDGNIELPASAPGAMHPQRRVGIGKLRHLDTSLLWIQQKVRDKEVQMTKVPGKENPGDSFTQYISGPEIQSHLARMGLEHEEGRAASAPAL